MTQPQESRKKFDSEFATLWRRHLFSSVCSAMNSYYSNKTFLSTLDNLKLCTCLVQLNEMCNAFSTELFFRRVQSALVFHQYLTVLCDWTGLRDLGLAQRPSEGVSLNYLYHPIFCVEGILCSQFPSLKLSNQEWGHSRAAAVDLGLAVSNLELFVQKLDHLSSVFFPSFHIPEHLGIAWQAGRNSRHVNLQSRFWVEEFANYTSSYLLK